MHTALHAVLAISIALGNLTASPADHSEHTAALPATSELISTIEQAEPALVLVDASEQQEQLALETIEQFESEGLELPPLRIEFFETTDGCDGNFGLYRPASTTEHSVPTVSICSSVPVILVHELGHAWDRASLDDETRAAFMALWSLETWNDHSYEWGERGEERAAHTVAFTLTLDAPTDDPNVLRYVCGYELLTGNPIPDPALADCDGFDAFTV